MINNVRSQAGIERKADSCLNLVFVQHIPSCKVDGHRGIESIEVAVYRSLALLGDVYSDAKCKRIGAGWISQTIGNWREHNA